MVDLFLQCHRRSNLNININDKIKVLFSCQQESKTVLALQLCRCFDGYLKQCCLTQKINGDREIWVFLLLDWKRPLLHVSFGKSTFLTLSELSHVIWFDSPHGLTFTWEDVAVYVFDISQPSLPTPFYSVLVSVSVFTALSTVFNSIKSSDNSMLSHSALPVLFLHFWSLQL